MCNSLLPAHLLRFVFTGLENVDQPLQLIGRVGGVHHEPKVLTSAKVHVEGHQPQAWLDLRCVKSPVSAIACQFFWGGGGEGLF